VVVFGAGPESDDLGPDLTAVFQQNGQHHFQRGFGHCDHGQGRGQVGTDIQRYAQAVGDAARDIGDSSGHTGFGTGHVGAGQFHQARHQIGQSPRVIADVGEEAVALLRVHIVGVVLKKFDRASDACQRCLELVAHGGSEVAQIARAAVHRLGHASEVFV